MHQISQGQAPTNPIWISPWADRIELGCSTKNLSYACENQIPAWKLEKGRKSKKKETVRKKRKKRRQKRQKAKKRKKDVNEKACPYQAVRAQANIPYVNMISNYHFEMLHHEEGEVLSHWKSIETILGNWIGALLLSNFRFWQNGWELFLHSFAWSRALTLKFFSDKGKGWSWVPKEQ